MKKHFLLPACLISMSGCLLAQQESPTPPTSAPVVVPATPTLAPAVSTPAPATPASDSDPTVPPPNAVQKFTGQGPSNTPPFTTANLWQVGWYSAGPLTITLGHLDGKPDEVVAQQTGPSHGSSFQPDGGKYYLKITGSGNWSVWTTLLGDSGATATTAAPTLAPASPLAPTSTPKPDDTDAYQGSIVIIEGSAGGGTGFLIKGPQGTGVITNQHVIWSNPNLVFRTVDGTRLIPTSLFGASDRDLAIFSVKDDDGKLPVLPFATDVAATVQLQDDTIVPGNSQGMTVVTNTPGKVKAIGPFLVEMTNPVFPGNSGSPVIDLRLKQAVGVVTIAVKSDTEGFVNKNSLADPNSAIAAVRYFSLRFDNVASWQPMDLQNFYNQTFFIDKFHKRTLELIAVYKSIANNSNGDAKGRARIDLASLAQEGVDQMVPGSFYLFNRLRVAREVAVRKRLIIAFGGG